jgi:hypothetical protein
MSQAASAAVVQWCQHFKKEREYEEKLDVCGSLANYTEICSSGAAWGHSTLTNPVKIKCVLQDERRRPYENHHTLLRGRRQTQAHTMIALILNSPISGCDMSQSFSVDVNGTLVYDGSVPTIRVLTDWIKRFLPHVTYMLLFNETTAILTNRQKGSLVVPFKIIDGIDPIYRDYMQKKAVDFTTCVAQRNNATEIVMIVHSGLWRKASRKAGRLAHLLKKEKNQCPRERMFSGSFAKARGRDEG